MQIPIKTTRKPSRKVRKTREKMNAMWLAKAVRHDREAARIFRRSTR